VDKDWRSLGDLDWPRLTKRRTGDPNDVVFGAGTNLHGPQYRKVRQRESHSGAEDNYPVSQIEIPDAPQRALSKAFLTVASGSYQ
jgi:hypothetical protein